METQEMNYASDFMEKSRYAQRCKDERAAGKGVFVAASCPTCWHQLPTGFVRDVPGFVFCKCGDEVETDDIVSALTPPEWGMLATQLRPAENSVARW